jgi:putative ABC transport system ATP-binding protein
VLKFNDVYKTYNDNGSNQVNALNQINLTIGKGESIVVTGPSGSGKSTLLQIIGCINRASHGEYLIENADTRTLSDAKLAEKRNLYFGFVLQSFGLIKYRNVIDNISIPLVLGKNKSYNIKEKCREALKKVGMESYETRCVWELSNGEQQRIAIARAIVNRPTVLLADEPTGALDLKNRNDIMEMFSEINKQGITTIVVTHDLSLIENFNRHISLKDGFIVDDKSI